MAIERKYYVRLPQMHDDNILLWFYSSYSAGCQPWFDALWEKLEKLQCRKPKESEMVGIRCFGQYKTDNPNSTWKFIDNVLPRYVYRRFKEQP